MEKISGILPTSARIDSADLKAAQPMRPGAPSFGNPQGVSSLADRVTRSAIEPSIQAHQELQGWRAKDVRNAAVAKNVSDGFFRKPTSEVQTFDDRNQDIARHLEIQSKPVFERQELLEIEPETEIASLEGYEELPPDIRGALLSLRA